MSRWAFQTHVAIRLHTRRGESVVRNDYESLGLRVSAPLYQPDEADGIESVYAGEADECFSRLHREAHVR